MTKKSTTPLPTDPNPKTFISAYGPKVSTPLFLSTENGAKQSFKDECDINLIMARYLKTGVLDFVQRNQPQYHDVTGLEYHEAMNIVAQSKTMFEELPSAIRLRFDNDPAQFLDFVNDPSNIDEAHDLGLLRPDYEKPAAEAPAPVPAAPAAVPAAKPASEKEQK